MELYTSITDTATGEVVAEFYAPTLDILTDKLYAWERAKGKDYQEEVNF